MRTEVESEDTHDRCGKARIGSTNSGRSPSSESVFTMEWNQCSGRAGIRSLAWTLTEIVGSATMEKLGADWIRPVESAREMCNIFYSKEMPTSITYC